MDDLIREVAEEHGTPPELLRQLLEWERAKVHLKKRRNKIPGLREILERFVLEETR